MSHTLKLASWLAAILLFVAAVYALAYFFYPKQPNPNTFDYTDLAQITKIKANGDGNATIAQYEVIQNNPNSTSQEKAVAKIMVAGLQYHLSGDKNALMQDIQNMKGIALDTRLPAFIRATAIDVLANEYPASGNDPAIFAEIYKDPPFDSFLAPNDPWLSSLNLDRQAFGMYPLSVAAMNVAFIASTRITSNSSLSTSTTAAYIAMAEEYLKKADTAAAGDAQTNPSTYSDTDRYTEYQRRRVVTIGNLAVAKGEPYKSTYRKEFEDFITFAQSQKSDTAREAVIGTRYQYARILALEGDSVAEKAQLDLLAQVLNGLSNPNVSFFAAFLRSEQTQHRPDDRTWIVIQDMYKLSPAFKAAADKIVGTT